MTVLDELNRFLEDRLEEFLQNNPHLELQALEEQLKEQQINTQRSLSQLQLQEQQIQNQILDTAREVELWHKRVSKAQAAGRPDLAQPAQNREAALFCQGNQLWGQMQGIQKQIQTLQEVLQDLSDRQGEVMAKLREMKTAQQQAPTPSGVSDWSSSAVPPKGLDPLDAVFQQWETDLELAELKRQIF